MRISERGRIFNCFLIDVVTACQLKCTMCPRTAFIAKLGRHDNMSLEAYKKIAEYFPHAELVYFTGWEGEPLLHKDIFAMVRIAKVFCSVGIVTNGMALTEETSKKLVELGLDYITVSMAGSAKETHERIRVGSEFDKICENVRALSNLKRAFKTKKPEVNLSFLMTKGNIGELPGFIEVAKSMDADRVTAPNLSYVATPLHDSMKAFSCDKTSENLDKIKEAEYRAGEHGIAFRAYPLGMEEVFICEEDPLANVYISSDGYVSPCVYLNFPIENIPRIFCGKNYAVKRTYFGNIAREDLFDIWNKEEYKEFRQKYRKRAELLMNIPLDFGDIQKLREKIEKLRDAPLPEVCKTCYKAYGI